MISTKTLRSPT